MAPYSNPMALQKTMCRQGLRRIVEPFLFILLSLKTLAPHRHQVTYLHPSTAIFVPVDNAAERSHSVT